MIDPRPVRCPKCKAKKNVNCFNIVRVDDTVKTVTLEIRHSHKERFERYYDTHPDAKSENSRTADSASQ